MTIEFFWTPGGPFARRCLMALAVKNLPYHSRQLDLTKQENRTPEFLAFNPTGMLPVLRDGSVVVRESQAIMFYLDRAYPNVPLYGKTPAEAAGIMQEICEQQSYAETVLAPLVGCLLFNRPTEKAVLDEGLVRFQTLLKRVDNTLSATGWMSGHRLTAADINLYPLLDAVGRALNSPKAASVGLGPVPIDGLEALASWNSRLELLAQRPDH